MIVIFNFANLFSAMSDNNIDPVVIWWWLNDIRRGEMGKENLGCIRSSVTI
jgi:hypothetical protein